MITGASEREAADSFEIPDHRQINRGLRWKNGVE